MEFILSTSGYFYPEKEEREKLESIGFTFKPSDSQGYTIDGEPTIKIETLQELIDFSNEWGQIIVSDGHIEIYDDYRE